MPDYKAPVDDMMFLLRDVFHMEDVLAELPEQKDNDLDTTRSILEEAGKFCSDILYPLNRTGDVEGCRLDEGVVHTPKGFPEAWKAFSEAGWGGLSAPTEFGGQNLPRTVQILVDEMLSGSNLSFGLFPGLTRGACEAIEAHASQKLKETYLPNMIAGVWTGAMAMTENNAGSDLGLLKTTATPRPDGSWTVTGSRYSSRRVIMTWRTTSFISCWRGYRMRLRAPEASACFSARKCWSMTMAALGSVTPFLSVRWSTRWGFMPSRPV